MSETDQDALRSAYAAIEQQIQELRSQVDVQLSQYSPERYPKNGTRLQCLRESLGGVAAMAALAAAHVGDEYSVTG